MIRSASLADIPEITALMRSVPGFWQPDWRADTVERAITAAGDLACVWEEDGELLGFVCAHDLGFRAYLSELVVAEDAREHGIGRHLVQHVQAELTARGCTVLISDVWKEAEEFYHALGWSPPDVILLRKKLGDGDLDGVKSSQQGG